jgi:hypothetical protein
MTKTVRLLFTGCFGFGVVLSLAALLGPFSPWLGLGFFAAAIIASGFEEGDVTKPLMLFATIGTALAMSILQFALHPFWWIAVVACAFIVVALTMDGRHPA